MKSSQGLLGFGVCLLKTCNCPGVNRERMTEMEGGKTEAWREKELMHGVYSASKLDADGSLGFNNTHTQIKHTHTRFPLVHLVLRKVFIRDISFMASEWTLCSNVFRLNQMTSPQAKAQIERKRKGERE